MHKDSKCELKVDLDQKGHLWLCHSNPDRICSTENFVDLGLDLYGLYVYI